MPVGELIATKLEENNMKRKYLAEQLYVSEVAVSHWIRGISYPSLECMILICHILNIEPREYFDALEISLMGAPLKKGA